PTCHNSHLPGFLFNADNFKAKGVDFIACTAVNDPFVMRAWASATGAETNITFLADGSADLAKALGLELDASAAGLGLRSKRYSMLVENGVVKALNVEADASKAETSNAETLLASL
ncbi:MAG: peroxiredoxin, partial [Alphaproteobacteria bacterium]